MCRRETWVSCRATSLEECRPTVTVWPVRSNCFPSSTPRKTINRDTTAPSRRRTYRTSVRRRGQRFLWRVGEWRVSVTKVDGKNRTLRVRHVTEGKSLFPGRNHVIHHVGPNPTTRSPTAPYRMMSPGPPASASQGNTMGLRRSLWTRFKGGYACGFVLVGWCRTAASAGDPPQDANVTPVGLLRLPRFDTTLQEPTRVTQNRPLLNHASLCNGSRQTSVATSSLFQPFHAERDGCLACLSVTLCPTPVATLIDSLSLDPAFAYASSAAANASLRRRSGSSHPDRRWR